MLFPNRKEVKEEVKYIRRKDLVWRFGLFVVKKTPKPDSSGRDGWQNCHDATGQCHMSHRSGSCFWKGNEVRGAAGARVQGPLCQHHHNAF